MSSLVQWGDIIVHIILYFFDTYSGSVFDGLTHRQRWWQNKWVMHQSHFQARFLKFFIFQKETVWMINEESHWTKTHNQGEIICDLTYIPDFSILESHADWKCMCLGFIKLLNPHKVSLAFAKPRTCNRGTDLARNISEGRLIWQRQYVACLNSAAGEEYITKGKHLIEFDLCR